MLFYPYSSSDDEMTIYFHRAMTNDKNIAKIKDLHQIGEGSFTSSFRMG
jgi:hypothetical protein